VSLQRTLIRRVPAVLLALAVLPALAGCGLFGESDPKTPTAPTSATLSAMLSVTDALVASATGNPATIPFSVSDPPPADESDLVASTRILVQSFSGPSAPQAVSNLPLVSDCNRPTPFGKVTLSGDGIVDDARDTAGYGTVTLTIGGLTATMLDCRGHGQRVTGSLALTVNDLVNITPGSVSGIDRWSVLRSESANGSLQITRESDNAQFNVSVRWSRNGTIGVDYDNSQQNISGPIDVNQTVTVQANGQYCSGHMTAVTLFGSYAWSCNGT